MIYREQGRLDEAIDGGTPSGRLAPGFVFGYYNLAHALFLSGRFVEARDIYADGTASAIRRRTRYRPHDSRSVAPPLATAIARSTTCGRC